MYDSWQQEQTPPHEEETGALLANVEAEAAVLGAMMLDNTLIDSSAEVLRIEDFAEPLHGRIYKCLQHLRKAGDQANPITLRPYFATDPAMRQLGGPGYLAQITGSGASVFGADGFARQIRDLSMLRQIRQAAADGADQIGSLQYDDDADSIGAVAAQIASNIVEASERASPVRVRSAANMMGSVRRRQAAAQAGVSIGAMCRALPEINDLLGPLAAAQYTIIGGRPSMGKSVLAQAIGWGCAVNGHPTLMVSNEMTEDQLGNRLAADLTHAMNEPVPYNDITRAKCIESQLLTIDEAQRRIEQHPFFLVAPERGTIEEIEAKVALFDAQLRRQGKRLELLIVDYIQIVGTTRKFESALHALNYVSARLLKLAKRYQMHVIALSQLSRKVEERPDKRPQLADLRESGQLEQDADNVVFAYRPEYYLEREKPGPNDSKKQQGWEEDMLAERGKLYVIGGKVRSDKITTVSGKFIGSSQAIRSRDWQPPLPGEESALLPIGA